MKIKELLKNGINELNKYEIDDAILKAKMLLGYELNVKNEFLAIHMEDEIFQEVISKFENDIQELINGKPIQYITNSQDFYGLNFYVDEDVLIPQPDTEILVEEVIGIAKENGVSKILDICTGSGAIAISIAKNVNSEMTASDISTNALQIARKNAANNSVNVDFIESDMFDKIAGKFDIIVSNPPYIESDTIVQLSQEVKNEPMLALDGGEDGLDFYKILAEESGKYLTKNGVLAVEIGYNQKLAVMEIFKKCGFRDVYAKKDFGNNDRIVVGRWR